MSERPIPIPFDADDLRDANPDGAEGKSETPLGAGATAADEPHARGHSIAAALGTAGAAADLDWSEALKTLEQMDREVPDLGGS